MFNNKNPTIAIIDSGIGGVAVLKQLIAKYKAGNYIYFADNLFMPYGNKKKKCLKERLDEIITKLKKEFNVDHIIIACNTASSVINQNKYENITIMQFKHEYVYYATKATQRQLSNINVIADNSLAKEIEINILNENKLDKIIKRHIVSRNLNKFSQFVLGCTHYELMSDVFLKYCPNTNIIKNSQFMIDLCKYNISNKDLNIVVLQSKKDINLDVKINKLIGR